MARQGHCHGNERWAEGGKRGSASTLRQRRLANARIMSPTRSVQFDRRVSTRKRRPIRTARIRRISIASVDSKKRHGPRPWAFSETGFSTGPCGASNLPPLAASPLRLPIQPDIFHSPAIIDAVDLQFQAMHVWRPARRFLCHSMTSVARARRACGKVIPNC